MAIKNQTTVYGEFAEDFSSNRLEDLCESNCGIQTGPFGSQLHQEDYVNVGTPIITVEHLDENRILHSDVPLVSDEDKKRLSKYTLKKGDIVFSRVGSVDRRALVHSDEEGWLFSGRCLRIRPDKSRIDPEYLSYFFGLPSFKEYIRSIAVGATMPSLNTQILSDVVIYYPQDKMEQQAIAHILSALDDKIELNRRMNETLEAIAQTTFRSWFVDFDPVYAKAEGRDTGLPKEIADLFPDSLVDSELGIIPIGWQVAKILELSEINACTLNKNDDLDSIEYIEISEVTHGTIRNTQFFERGKEPSRARRKLRHGDTVLSTVRPDRGSYFLCLNPSKNLVASTGFAVISPTKSPWSFIHAALTQPDVFKYLGHQADGGAYPAVRPEIIGGLKVIWPDQNTIVQIFHKICAPLYERIGQNQCESRILANIRDLLLPKLILGELRVPDAELLIKEASS